MSEEKEPLHIDFKTRITIPIRDARKNGEVCFLMDMYGLSYRDVCYVPGGGPIRKSVERRKLDPNRFKATT